LQNCGRRLMHVFWRQMPTIHWRVRAPNCPSLSRHDAYGSLTKRQLSGFSAGNANARCSGGLYAILAQERVRAPKCPSLIGKYAYSLLTKRQLSGWTAGNANARCSRNLDTNLAQERVVAPRYPTSTGCYPYSSLTKRWRCGNKLFSRGCSGKQDRRDGRRWFYSSTCSLSSELLPAVAAREERENLRQVCDEVIRGNAKNTIHRRCRVNAQLPRDEVSTALLDGLKLQELLPGAPPTAIADVHRDILACVDCWTKATGRDRPSVLVTLTRKNRKHLDLHIDHVDVRVLCTLFGKGTEWVTNPNWLHFAASFADHDRGGAIADVLTGAVLSSTQGTLSRSKEREIVVIRGTAHRALWRGQARLHRGPDVSHVDGEWRLVVKVDDGPGWWRDERLSFLSRPAVSRQKLTWGQMMLQMIRRQLKLVRSYA